MTARLALAALAAGCTPAPDASSLPDEASRVSLTAADADHPLVLAVGQRATLALRTNPTTGFQWTLTDSAGGTLARDVAPVYVIDPEPGGGPVAPGRGGTETWTFRALRPGTGTLRLDYRRAFQNSRHDPPGSLLIPVTVR